MNKESFIAFMEAEEYKFLGKPDVSNMMSPDPDFDWKQHARQNEFQRGASIICVTDEDIHKMKGHEFNMWFKERSKYYHFYDEWKKKFKGSEFLIPVVEEEIATRLRMETFDFGAKLMGLKEGAYNIDELIEEYRQKANPEGL
jgi:hypothetical protein